MRKELMLSPTLSRFKQQIKKFKLIESNDTRLTWKHIRNPKEDSPCKRNNFVIIFANSKRTCQKCCVRSQGGSLPGKIHLDQETWDGNVSLGSASIWTRRKNSPWCGMRIWVNRWSLGRQWAHKDPRGQPRDQAPTATLETLQNKDRSLHRVLVLSLNFHNCWLEFYFVMGGVQGCQSDCFVTQLWLFRTRT